MSRTIDSAHEPVDHALQCAAVAQEGGLRKAFVGAMESLSEEAFEAAEKYHLTLRGETSYGGPKIEYATGNVGPEDLEALFEELEVACRDIDDFLSRATTAKEDVIRLRDLYEGLTVLARSAALRARPENHDIPVWKGPYSRRLVAA